MATSGFVLCKTGDFYALPCLTVNETHAYFCALIQAQPIKTRVCHMTRIQAIHIIEMRSVIRFVTLTYGCFACSGDKPGTLQIAIAMIEVEHVLLT